MKTLGDDFSSWWDMEKYKNIEIPAKKLSNVEIISRHGSNTNWPGEHKDVHYWVELETGVAVGMRHGSSHVVGKNGKIKIKYDQYAEFPVVKL